MLTAFCLAASLAVPAAADTTTYVVVGHGQPAGEMRVATNADSIVVTYGHIDRNRGRWLQNRYGVNAVGAIVSGETRPMTREGVVGRATERFELRDDAPVQTLRNATAFEQARVARLLLARPSTDATPRAEVVADTALLSTTGRERVRLIVLHTGSVTPQAVWLDASGQLAAGAVAWFITAHPRFVPALDAMRAIEMAYRDGTANALAARIPQAVRGPVKAIRNVSVFDSERGVAVGGQTVIVRDDRITAVGATNRVDVPRGAQVIDGTGKTLVPGLWDMHTHFQLTSQTTTVLRQLAGGITTIRDVASDTDIGVSHRDRANAFTLVSPRVIFAGILEGPPLWRGPTDVLIGTEQQAREWVARYDSLGFKQVKLYNLVHPDLVPTIAAEAHARGMRVSGHVARGLSVPVAIRLGYDEINHAAFLFSTFYQDSLYWPTMRAYSAVAAAVAPHVDVDGAPMTALIANLKAHGTVVDGTFNLWMRDTSGADAVEAKRANAAYLRLIKRLYDAGVTLVAGTDGSNYNDELEQYERAGIAAPDVLRIATLGAARVMREDADYGSIAVGKVADFVLVHGRPHERVRDLRNVELVFRAGRAYTPKALTDAASGGLRN